MGAQDKAQKKQCCCPYCDEEIMALDLPYCQVCKGEIHYCPQCRRPLPRETEVCPHCGAKVKEQEK
jgi:hypothetical protein